MEGALAAANAIQGQQWHVMLMGYGDNRPGRTLDEFHANSARTAPKLPAIFGEAADGAITREVVTYHQLESRRRHFTEAARLPARLVATGDAVASVNPVYGQGMSSAALHASYLASYLDSGTGLDAAATEFFRLQQVVVDAAWAVSAGGDAAHFAAFADSRHYWDTTVLPDGTLRAEWAAASRMKGGRLMTVTGVEHVRLDGNGLIADLRDEFTRLPG